MLPWNTRPQRLLIAAGATIMALTSGVLAGPGTAYASGTSSSPIQCVTGAFRSSPAPGKTVAPGHKLVYTVIVKVEGSGDPVAGCSRDVMLSPLLDFGSITPAGAYWPDTSSGPMASVEFTGPFPAGTVLRGKITMRVRSDAPAGAVIESTSGATIQNIVG